MHRRYAPAPAACRRRDAPNIGRAIYRHRARRGQGDDGLLTRDALLVLRPAGSAQAILEGPAQWLPVNKSAKKNWTLPSTAPAAGASCSYSSYRLPLSCPYSTNRTRPSPSARRVAPELSTRGGAVRLHGKPLGKKDTIASMVTSSITAHNIVEFRQMALLYLSKDFMERWNRIARP